MVILGRREAGTGNKHTIKIEQLFPINQNKGRVRRMEKLDELRKSASKQKLKGVKLGQIIGGSVIKERLSGSARKNLTNRV